CHYSTSDRYAIDDTKHHISHKELFDVPLV
ncbi:unnamed protein product, partial [marine sediment metagenome]